MTKLIAWVEIPSTNFERAVKFYNNVFKLGLKESDFGDEKMACFPSGDGAIIYSKGFSPSKTGVLVSLSTNNIDETLGLVKSNNGKVVQTKTAIQRKAGGYFAIFTDSEGNKVGLYSNS